MVTWQIVILIISVQILVQLFFEFVKMQITQKLMIKYQEEKVNSFYTQIRKIITNEVKTFKSLKE